MKKMELILPVNSLEIHENEKEYIDGGFAVSTTVVAAAINTAIGLAIGGAGVAGVRAWITSVGKEQAKKIFTRTITSKLIAIGCTGLAGFIGAAVNFAINYSDIGGAVASYLDSVDTYHNNGWIG
ncbi:hypothetical protein [Clostridium paridis]|uniref:Uncharacterized protein n=1 Tax=Clostridium paridis TaxID=2803863 RepID=A0A937FGW2_9CLOT|nr:hypothetical protein [Clostridium paridis]MBL4931803.1 hypothetical protein [Clostridium paridis]